MNAAARSQAAHAIATDITSVTRRYMGRGPRHVEAAVLGTTVVIMLRDIYTAAERTLIDDSQQSAVHAGREAFQAAMRERFQSIVEQHTGRKAIAFMSTNHIDPDLAVEIIELDGPPSFEE